ncbi:uncharacterized protein LOC110113174 [Dendrobium catenatum]|uniref:PARP catalytic domain-containing protein n=1 Tax=Dendrobium catenatum TaxID=906689 RepID=A0A2I0WNB4_9ASPA|nr:uncharacterized protein LOC110113174 [Dendrobium catenatum]PKU77155.1 hypothetical protein MA16_Dca013190 [Dendrobium catenatum]
MATGWLKSLHCKSNAVEDVYLPKRMAPAKILHAPAFSCRSSSQALRDALFLISHKLPPPPNNPPSPTSSSSPAKTSQRNRSQTLSKTLNPKPKSRPKPKAKQSTVTSSPPATLPLPTLDNLPQSHSSRRVVEIIFRSSWSSLGAPFPGEIEMLFRVHNPPLAVARFEECRAAVRSRADDPRCAADGNEMMRFHSSFAAGGEIYDAGVARCAVGKLEGVRTFAGSGAAHENSGRGTGRRAMLVCRVIAGRVRDPFGPNSEADSVCLGKSELLVIDPRAVLPCFLIIYKV